MISILTETNAEIIAELQEKYESEKKERINRELNNNLETEKTNKNFLFTWFSGFTFGIRNHFVCLHQKPAEE